MGLATVNPTGSVAKPTVQRVEALGLLIVNVAVVDAPTLIDPGRTRL